MVPMLNATHQLSISFIRSASMVFNLIDIYEDSCVREINDGREIRCPPLSTQSSVTFDFSYLLVDWHQKHQLSNTFMNYGQSGSSNVSWIYHCQCRVDFSHRYKSDGSYCKMVWRFPIKRYANCAVRSMFAAYSIQYLMVISLIFVRLVSFRRLYASFFSSSFDLFPILLQ